MRLCRPPIRPLPPRRVADLIESLEVRLGERSYPIRLGRGALDSLPDFLKERTRGGALFVVADAQVAKPWAARVLESARAISPSAGLHLVPSGETSKSVGELTRIWDALVAARLGRDGAIVAVGGGVIGDLAGFAAASYLRGVDFIHVPTTLLAMVDSSVGGKVAINHPGGKNLLGAFWQPRGVLIDPQVLSTLADAEYRSGLAEVVKYGVIADADLFHTLEARTADVLAREAELVVAIVGRSCAIKAGVVERDERELGERALLNFGHTLGHALEGAGGYSRLRHGEAVAIGMVAAGALALETGTGWSAADQSRLEELLRALGLPVTFPADFPGDAEVVALTRTDKKARGGVVRYVLPSRIGAAGWGFAVDEAAAVQALAARRAPG